MIAHYKIILIFDHSTDNIFIFQNSILESFLALHLPNSTFNLIFSDENSFYEIYEINIYEYINDSYKNKEIISLNLQKLGEFNNNEINNDEYELYFWVENFDVKITDKIKKYIDSLFENILINVSGYCKDDLNNISNNEFLDFTSNLCLYSTINNTTINNNENYINWTSISDWENFNNQENLLKISLNGTGYLKISKQRLKKILNIDIESNLSGIIENDKFNLLNINQPQITPFERLQNILSIKNI